MTFLGNEHCVFGFSTILKELVIDLSVLSSKFIHHLPMSECDMVIFVMGQSEYASNTLCDRHWLV